MAYKKIMMLIDTSKCIGCKACQVACKQWHSLPADGDEGTATSSTNTSLIDSAKTWAINQWTDMRVLIREGTGTRESKTIVSNTATELTVDSAWTTNPDGTSEYAITTNFTGSYSNPPDVSGTTLTAVKYTEFEDIRKKLYFVFFKKQCMHCNQAECQILCSKGVEKTREGFVIFNDKCKPENVRVPGNEAAKKAAFLACCPYDIPRFDDFTGRFVKCDFCVTRFGGYYTTYRDGKPTTACELTCPPGAIKTGPAKEIMKLAKERLYDVKVNLNHNKATLWGGRGRVVFLLTEHYSNYGLPPAD